MTNDSTNDRNDRNDNTNAKGKDMNDSTNEITKATMKITVETKCNHDGGGVVAARQMAARKWIVTHQVSGGEMTTLGTHGGRKAAEAQVLNVTTSYTAWKAASDAAINPTDTVAVAKKKKAAVKKAAAKKAAPAEDGLAIAAPGGALGALGVRATMTGMQLPEGMSVKEWGEVGQSLGRFALGHNWCVGDWYDYATKAGYSSDDVVKTLDTLGMSDKTAQNYRAICRKYAPEHRLAGLSWTHFVHAAGLEERVRMRILRSAANGHWNVTRLRERVLREKAGADVAESTVAPPKTNDWCEKALGRVAEDFDRIAGHMRGAKGCTQEWLHEQLSGCLKAIVGTANDTDETLDAKITFPAK